VKRLDEQIAQRLSHLMDISAKVLGPIDFHDGISLGRFDRMLPLRFLCMQKKGQGMRSEMVAAWHEAR
jgi:hypothetical protein